MNKLLASALLCLLVAGCSVASSPASHYVTGEVRPAISPADVAVFIDEVPAGYSQIATLSANSSNSMNMPGQSESEEVLEHLKAEAAALGANGVILVSLYDEPVTVREGSFNGTQMSSREAVRYRKKGEALAVFIE